MKNQITVATILFLCMIPVRLFAAGGVVGEAGSCMIEIGFYTAHFTVYQPESSGSKEFCEDLPEVSKTVFILDYLHNSLGKVPVDFRIIRDDQGFGQFARWEDILSIEDVDSQTVFFQPPDIRTDQQMTVEYTFPEAGSYIGIVTAPHPTRDIVYQAVFAFDVGNTGYGYWPLVILVILILQLQFLFGRRILDRWRQRRIEVSDNA